MPWDGLKPFRGQPFRADIAAWNLRWFNGEGEEWDARVGTVADAIVDIDADRFALTEIAEQAMADLKSALAVRGFEAGILVKDVPGGQDLAVLFNANKAQITDINPQYDASFRKNCWPQSVVRWRFHVRRYLFV